MSKKNWFKENFKSFWAVFAFVVLLGIQYFGYQLNKQVSDAIMKQQIEQLGDKIDDITSDVKDNLSKVVYLDNKTGRLEERLDGLRHDVDKIEKRLR